jgi:glycosyltransferase involved in cell wall biosynthesis
LPAEVEVAGLPMPEPAAGGAPSPPGAPAIRRIVCFAQIEERKGIRNFVKALQHLAPSLDSKPEVVLLGGVHPNDGHLLEFALGTIHDAGYSVSQKANLDSEAAQDYLSRVAGETLCVIPSPADNHPYAVVEASLVIGLNLIVTSGGGVPEVLGSAPAQTCGPHAMDLAAKIADRLRQPQRADELARYDCAAANRRWLAVHDRALALAAKRSLPAPSIASPGPRPSIDVCVTYYQKPAYLGQLIDSLERQTEADFHVIAVNDGSPDEESNRVFEKYAERVKPRGWDFFRQENAFVDAARNSAARRGSAEFILFIDGDDLPARNAVARLREAIVRSGDDAVAPAAYLFASEDSPFDPTTGEVRLPAFATIVPLGIDLVGGIVNPSAFPGSMFIVRRSVFEQMGGFTEQRGAGSEDWEFYVRLVLAGHTVDILPELLHYYRQVEGSLSRSLLPESSTRRMLDAYEDILRPLGLHGAALALCGLHRASVKLERRVDELSVKAQPLAPHSFFSGASQYFENTKSNTKSKRIESLRSIYRKHVSMETRLRLHRVLLEPFFGPYDVTGDKSKSA